MTPKQFLEAGGCGMCGAARVNITNKLGLPKSVWENMPNKDIDAYSYGVMLRSFCSYVYREITEYDNVKLKKQGLITYE